MVLLFINILAVDPQFVMDRVHKKRKIVKNPVMSFPYYKKKKRILTFYKTIDLELVQEERNVHEKSELGSKG